MSISNSSFIDEDLKSVKPKVELKKNTIILDIDECLINTPMTYEKYYTTSGPHNSFLLEKSRMVSFRRPYLEKFLSVVFEKFNVGFWTTGTKDYAKEVLTEILLGEKMDAVKFILARENINNKSRNKGMKDPLNKYDKANYSYWKNDNNPTLSVGYIDVLKNKKFNI